MKKIAKKFGGTLAVFVVIILLGGLCVRGESSTTGIVKECSISTDELDVFQYLLYIPQNPTKDMPLIVYLHGASGKGDEISLLTSEEDFPKYLKSGDLENVNAYVLIPQLSSKQKGWSDVNDSLYALIQKTVAEYAIDEKNISLAGFSMGGTGTWNFALEYPELIARIAPLAGSAKAVLKQSKALADVPVWAFVGAEDTVISPNSSEQMVAELKRIGGNAKVTVFEGAEHEAVPQLTWLDDSNALVEWLTGSDIQVEQSDKVQADKKQSNKKKQPEQKNESDNNDMNMYENSDFIEKEQPELNEETKALISAYQKNPTMDNYLELRDMVIANYNAVLERKELKLEELKVETAGKPRSEEIIDEMEEIVQEMYITYWNRINSSMLRFTDTRLLKWKISTASQYEYIPVMGAGESIYVKRTPVTNAEYAQFLNETGYPEPSNWSNGSYPKGEDDYPINFVSYEDAQAYCEWLTQEDGVNTYRLPNESEWELAAGHMPKDADFNCGVNDGRTPVEQYADVTRGAHGAVDFWGNVWEWTSTQRSVTDETTILGVKGGSWESDRTDCRTEYREEGRDASEGYEDVGFRVIQVKNGEEPEQKVELATLANPVVSATSDVSGTVTLSWESVEGAVEYQIFEYEAETGLVYMLDRTDATSITLEGLEKGMTYRYIVQPISYIEIADNVSAENSIAITCK